MTIIERIEKLCNSHNITVYKLEKDIGMAKNTIRKWDVSSPTCKWIILVADYFNVSVDFLLGRTTNTLSHKSDLSEDYVKVLDVLANHNVSTKQTDSLIRIINEIFDIF